MYVHDGDTSSFSSHRCWNWFSDAISLYMYIYRPTVFIYLFDSSFAPGSLSVYRSPFSFFTNLRHPASWLALLCHRTCLLQYKKPVRHVLLSCWMWNLLCECAGLKNRDRLLTKFFYPI